MVTTFYVELGYRGGVPMGLAEGGERLKRPTLHKKGKHCAFLFKLLQSNLVHCRRPWEDQKPQLLMSFRFLWVFPLGLEEGGKNYAQSVAISPLAVYQFLVIFVDSIHLTIF